jgi:hypothetical protein
MKSITLFYPILFLIMITSFCSYGQLTITPNGVFAACPGESINYTVTNSITPSCTYDWTVTKGSIQGGFQDGDESTFSGGNMVSITWFDVTTSGQIQVTARNCDNVAGNSTLTKSIPILSLFNENPGVISGASIIAPNVTTNQLYSIPQINFPNIGSGDNSPKQVNGYEWQIPSGWTVVSGGNTKSITLKPDNCSAGNIRVRGKNTLCNITYYTNWSTIKSVTRALATPGLISGPSFVICADGGSKVFSIPAVPGATSYTWTFPSGWVVSGPSNGSTITLIPNGSTGGTITVKANACSLQSPASSKVVSLNLTNPNTPPSITNSSSLICNGSNQAFVLNNVPAGATVTWAATPSFLFDTNSGSSVNASLDAASNSSCCQGTLTYTISTACGPAPAIQKNVQVGAPHVTFNIQAYPGPDPSCYFEGSINSFQAIQATGSPGTYNGFQWGWRNLTNSTSAIEPGDVYYTFFPWDAGSYEIWVRATNQCGISALESVKNVTVGLCFSALSVYPNPAENYVDIEVKEDEFKSFQSRPYEVILVDDNGVEKIRTSTKKTKRIDTSSLPNGKYILRIFYNQEVLERQIIIKR